MCVSVKIFLVSLFYRPGSDRVPVSGNTGSGVIVRADGLIVTNAHVVHGSNEVTVTMNDGSKHKGFVNTVDQVCDLATVKIQGVSQSSPSYLLLEF